MAEVAKPTVSFGFSKKSEASKLVDSKLRDDSTREENEEKDIIKSVEDNEITGTKKKVVKKELVIPMIPSKKFGVPAASNQSSNGNAESNGDLSIEQLAAKEILEESQRITENWENRGKSKNANTEIPLFMQTKDTENEEITVEESTAEDYEAVPVEEYGMAMLRGMGFKAQEGIGLKNKGVIAPVQVALRPKGLGLGATPPTANKTNSKSHDENQEKLEIRKGSFVFVVSGRRQGLYGQIESLDENTGQVSVRMAVGGQVLSISELCLKPVTQKEYKDSSRILNKAKFDEVKAQREEKERLEEEERRRKKKERHRSRSRSRSRSRDRSDRDREKRKRAERKEEKKREKESKRAKGESTAWLHPNLRVRCVDETFKKGKYFKKKMIVIDVMSRTHCSCKTEEGIFLDSVDITMLETVIPRDDPAYVMVVSGKRKGQICEVIERDRKRCVASVQLLPDRDEIFQISYDNVCEYTGDV